MFILEYKGCTLKFGGVLGGVKGCSGIPGCNSCAHRCNFFSQARLLPCAEETMRVHNFDVLFRFWNTSNSSIVSDG